jgi:hypothetical protein
VTGTATASASACVQHFGMDSSNHGAREMQSGQEFRPRNKWFWISGQFPLLGMNVTLCHKYLSSSVII